MVYGLHLKNTQQFHLPLLKVDIEADGSRLLPGAEIESLAFEFALLFPCPGAIVTIFCNDFNFTIKNISSLLLFFLAICIKLLQ